MSSPSSLKGCLPVAALLLSGSILVLPCLAQAAGLLTAEDAHYRVTLARIDEAKSGKKEFHFDILNLKEGEPRSFVLRNMAVDVQELDLYGGKLVIYGFVEGGASGITIVDLERLHQLDFLLAYQPQASNTGRYIVYKKFYPRFARSQVRSDLVLIYDLDRSPQENRLEDGPVPVEVPPGSPEYILASERAGYPIYPLSHSRDESYRVWVDEEEMRHLVAVGFLWGEQDERVLFIDTQAGREWVVVVDLKDGPGRPKVAKLALGEASFRATPVPTERDGTRDHSETK